MSNLPPDEQVYLGYHTLTRMQPRQLAGIARRKLYGAVLPRLPVDSESWYERAIPAQPPVRSEPIASNNQTLRESLSEATKSEYERKATQAATGAPTFMNQTLNVESGQTIAWEDDRFEKLPHLWSLKLYAFQPLYWLCRAVEPGDAALQKQFDRWIADWIETQSIGQSRYLRREYTPWAVSLRIMNWSRYLAWRDDDSPDNGFERSFKRAMYKNALFLNNHIEWDVGGNHLIENGAALVIAGTLFQNPEWTEAGNSVLKQAAKTQFLPCGYHFERSPMYHLLVTMRYLTVCDLLDSAGQQPPALFTQTAEEGVAFVQFLRPPDGQIPLLNDAVHGQSVPLDDCLRYASALGVGPEPDEQSQSTQEKTAGGYHWLDTKIGRLLIDGAPVGPAHLPGHSHSDTLSLLLWINGQQLLTDTGTAGYVSGFERGYARGVQGHSTVQVGETEPIPIGGKYLMGPRPTPETRFYPGDLSLFEGRYSATPYRASGYTHLRRVYAGDHWWLLRDTVTGHENRTVTSRLQLAPELTATIHSGGRVRIEMTDDTSVFVYPLKSTAVSLRTGPYFPRFGESRQRTVLELEQNETAGKPIETGFVITEADHEHVSVEPGRNCLCVGTDEITLPRGELEDQFHG